MKFATRRTLALLGYVVCLASGPLAAQVGPIQPVLVLSDGKVETPHVRPDMEDASVPLDVYVAPDGTVYDAVVSPETGNQTADNLAVELLLAKRFLPALDAHGKPASGMVKVTVNMFKRGNKKVVRITLKPPPMTAESERVRRLTCRDFVWEVSRIKTEAGIRDASYEVMPYLSARMYMTQKEVSSEVEDKFWDMWPNTLRKVIDRCEKAADKRYFTDVLVPALEGVMPTRDTATAAAR